MTCRYRITVQKEMQNVKFSYYDAAVYDAVYTLYKTNYSKFTLTDLLRVMSGDEKVRFYCTKSRIQKREQKLRVVPGKTSEPSLLTTVKKFRCVICKTRKASRWKVLWQIIWFL